MQQRPHSSKQFPFPLKFPVSFFCTNSLSRPNLLNHPPLRTCLRRFLFDPTLQRIGRLPARHFHLLVAL
eukprot:m.238661 g.238661  ORF g.238661 m.238661 type:complete len:69 (+) comp54360_c1_seq12:200-406(+)